MNQIFNENLYLYQDLVNLTEGEQNPKYAKLFFDECGILVDYDFSLLDEYLDRIEKSNIRPLLLKSEGDIQKVISYKVLVEYNLSQIEIDYAILYYEKKGIMISKGLKQFVLPKNMISLEQNDIVKMLTMYRENKDYEIRNKIIDDYCLLMLNVIHSFKKKKNMAIFNIRDGELVGAATMGLINACDKYDINSEISFKSYAAMMINFYVNREICRLIVNNGNISLGSAIYTSMFENNIISVDVLNDKLDNVVKSIENKYGLSNTVNNNKAINNLINILFYDSYEEVNESYELDLDIDKEILLKRLEKCISKLDIIDQVVINSFYGINGYKKQTLDSIALYLYENKLTSSIVTHQSINFRIKRICRNLKTMLSENSNCKVKNKHCK